MIKYNLKCKQEHNFESWFGSSADFEKLLDSGMLECAVCGDKDVEKALMAPGVSTGKSKETIKQDQALSEAMKNMKKSLKSAKNVGWQFATEARAMHYGDKEQKPIYGRAEPADAIELIKEGVGIAPLPFDPDKKDN